MVALGAVAIALAPAVATAQSSADKDLEKARRHYKAAEKAEAERRWKDAAREYKAARDSSGDPVLFFRLANAHEKAGDCGAAVVYYRRYIKEARPEKSFVALAEKRIARCEAGAGAEAGGKTPEEPPPETPEEPAETAETPASGEGDTDPSGAQGSDPFDDPLAGGVASADPVATGEPSWQRTAAWISIGAAVAFATTGGVLGLSAAAREDDIAAQIEFRDTNGLPVRYQGNAAERYDDLVDQGERLELLSYVSLGAAGVAVAAAVVFFVLDPGDDPAGAAASVGPALGPDLIGVTAGWRFQ
jgi:hypothetical protein